jgi:hypothetical protein
MIKVTYQNIPDPLLFSLKENLKTEFQQDLSFSPDVRKYSDIHVQIDVNKKDLRLPGKFNVLILREPQSVIPFQYKFKFLKKFDLVIPMGEKRAKNLRLDEWVNPPYDYIHHDTDESLRTQEVVMVNSAKFSANHQSLYGFRRKVSKKLRLLGISYDLIGDNWKMSKKKELRERLWAVRKEFAAGNVPNLYEAFSNFFYGYPEYIGRVDNKINVMSKYKYAMIIENENDYISEKLFDAIAAGCVPIYVGASLNKYKKLAKCVIEFSSYSELINYFSQDYQESIYEEKKLYIDQKSNYSDDLEFFSTVYVSKKLSEIIYRHYRENIKTSF